MCEKTIEGSLNDIDGITLADWDKETDKMMVSFNPNISHLMPSNKKLLMLAMIVIHTERKKKSTTAFRDAASTKDQKINSITI